MRAVGQSSRIGIRLKPEACTSRVDAAVRGPAQRARGLSGMKGCVDSAHWLRGRRHAVGLSCVPSCCGSVRECAGGAAAVATADVITKGPNRRASTQLWVWSAVSVSAHSCEHALRKVALFTSATGRDVGKFCTCNQHDSPRRSTSAPNRQIAANHQQLLVQLVLYRVPSTQTGSQNKTRSSANVPLAKSSTGYACTSCTPWRDESRQVDNVRLRLL